MRIQTVEIEPEFDKIVIEVGGRLTRSMIGKSPPFDNADYIFHDHKLVAELKCLTKDEATDPKTRSTMRRLWIAWRQRGLVSGSVPAVVDAQQLPEACKTDIYRAMGKPIRRRVQKANKQIRETKAALGLHDYRGVLFIANDGNFMFSPVAMIHAIQLMLQRDFREIRHFLFFTANMYLAVKGSHQPVLCWISFDMENNKNSSAEDLYSRLRLNWMRRHEQITGIPSESAELKDEEMEKFWFGRYLRR